MKRRMKDVSCLLLCLVLSLSLCACSVKGKSNTSNPSLSDLSLPLTESNPPAAPYGDQTDNEVYRASIYYAASDGTVSAPSTRVLWLNSGATLEKRLAEEVLKSPGGDQIMVAPKNSRIAFVEAAGPVATVNVLSGAPLTDNDKALLMEAMGKTLLEAEGVTGVNVLIGGRAPELSCMPVGLITASTDVSQYLDESLHAGEKTASAFTRSAAVYYPSSSDTLVLPVSTSLSINAESPVESLFQALTNAPQGYNVLSAVPSADTLFEKKSHYSLTPAGERILNIHLASGALTALNESGHDRQMYLASIVLTLTSFLPETDGVILSIGGKTVTEVPVKNAQNQKFASGIMRRSDFTHLIGKNVPLYFAGGDGYLKKETRAISIQCADNARERISALMAGPDDASLLPLFPDGVKSTDILGIRVSGNVASVNFTSNVYSLMQSFSEVQEEMFVYGLVNTLSEISGINGVRLYFGGETGGCLVHRIHLTGEILKNPGKISDS